MGDPPFGLRHILTESIPEAVLIVTVLRRIMKKHIFCMVVSQRRRCITIAACQRVLDGFVREGVRSIPRTCPLMQFGHLLGMGSLKLAAQRFGKQRGTAIPLRGCVERLQEQVGLRQVAQQVGAVAALRDGIAQRRAQAAEHSSLPQEGRQMRRQMADHLVQHIQVGAVAALRDGIAQRRAQAAEHSSLPQEGRQMRRQMADHLVQHIVEHKAMLPGEGGERLLRVGLPLHRQRGQMQARRPAFGALVERVDLRGRESVPGCLLRECSSFGSSEAQVGGAQVGQLAGTYPLPLQFDLLARVPQHRPPAHGAGGGVGPE
jgi:hypothetical protein